MSLRILTFWSVAMYVLTHAGHMQGKIMCISLVSVHVSMSVCPIFPS